MKKKFIYIFGVLGVLAFSGLANQVKAQTNNSNVLQEIKLNPNDGFNELRALLIQNFDFANPQLSEGEVNSVIKFNITKEGKISNVYVNGECKHVSEELKEVMTHLLYKFSPTDKRATERTTYTLPVKVYIASR